MYEIIMHVALSMLSHKKMTIQETTRRLIRKFPADQAMIGQAVQRLQEMGYLNDYSYVQAYARDRMKFHPRGISMIKMELRKKGLSKDIIDEALVTTELHPAHGDGAHETHEALNEFAAAEKLAEQYMKRSSF